MARIALSIVHHANQLMITDGYSHRDGISEVCAGYLDVLELHRAYEVPMSLHLSGTLLETMLWHRPDQFARIRNFVGGKGMELVGGTYSEPIMPTLSPAMNRLQLTTAADLMIEHFGMEAAAIRTAWLPERVWSPELFDIFTDPAMRCGPYRRVLVDDRILTTPDAGPVGPFRWKDRNRPPVYRSGMVDPESLRPRTVVAGERRLTMVPICSYLRYLFPPRSDRQWNFLLKMLADLAARAAEGENILLVYADDMERSAGVGGWESAIADYERLLAWLATSELIELVELDSWLDRHHFTERGPIPAGSYHELEIDWAAGSDFTGWSRDPKWVPYAELLESVESTIREARRELAWHRGACELLVLAYRLLMIGQHETAWRDPVFGCLDGSRRHLAPWVRATAAHAALARPLVAAAHWAAGGGCAPRAEQVDIDGDGESELVLAGDRFWCVVSPRWGARLTLMCHRDSSGCSLVVGNPADDWNYQEELHRFMDLPAAHPGALTDRDNPHDEWFPRQTHCSEGAVVDLYRPGDTAWGRRYALLDGIPGLVVCLRGMEPGRTLDNFLTPDYLNALSSGDRGIAVGGSCFAGRRYGNRSSWVGFDPDQVTVAVDGETAAGHGHLIGLSLTGTHAEMIIGAGPVTDEQVATWLREARRLVDIEFGRESAGEPDALAGETR
ncbi:hypothetical protein [Nocardia alni]|uniref:hypothetical protein n=1 Tax=Nocardia alni TaxID=2815723 RepID=UPI001C24DBC7|nr:hypothetical protein [Nocardia alni]